MKKRCRKLLAYFDKRILLQEFDNQIPKLIDNFPKDIPILIKVRIKKDFIEAKLSENPNKKSIKRWEWDLKDAVKLN